jgi:hypothetical protein
LHAIAKPLVSRNVFLTNNTLAPFLSCARARQALFKTGSADVGLLLRSLTISIDTVIPARDPTAPDNPFLITKDN